VAPIRDVAHWAHRQEQLANVKTFFILGEKVRQLQGSLERAVALADADSARATDPEDIQRELNVVLDHREALRPRVEETLEAEISAVLAEMGVIRRVGPLRWPPVDFTFEPAPLVLVTSPREEVKRMTDLLLRAGIPVLELGELEAEVEAEEELSALIVQVGGIATYPASVTPNGSLHTTLSIASHEWLHHHLTFTSLGQRWWQGGDIQSINETLANIAGEEIGDATLTRLTGQLTERAPYQPPSLEPDVPPEPGVFDFRREMRETRLRLNELLANNQVAAAERYLEKRRLLFVENGYYIRKLNQAYFAFYGTYANDPASISLIEPQLRAVRAASAGLAEFLTRLSGITTAEELEVIALESGWERVDAATQ
jgi:peptidoglycan/xylan/chitin deacetylase (PgdA/CDA1 family)